MKDAAASGRCITVLLVDDDPMVRQTVSRALTRRFSVRILQADNGLAALEILDAEPVDLAILDFEMPVMTGLDVLKTIRRAPKFESLPVIMVTGNAAEESVCRVIELGVIDYILKPVTPTALQERLAPLIARIARAAPSVDSRRGLNLLPSSRILIVEEDDEIRGLQEELFGFVKQVDSTPMGTAALRHCVSTGYDAILIGRVAGVVDSDLLAEKLRLSRHVRRPHVIAVADGEDIEAKRKTALFDGVMLRTADPEELLRHLAEHVAPGNVARLLLSSASPYAGAMFTAARELVQETLQTDVSLQTVSPSFLHHEHMWTGVRVEVRSADIAWYVRLICPYSLAQTLASKLPDADDNREVDSDSRLRELMATTVSKIAGAAKEGFESFHVDFRVGESVFSAASERRADVDMTAGCSRWLSIDSERSGALVQLVPRTTS